MSDSVRSHRWQPTRLHCPWDSPGKNTGVGCHFLLQCTKVKSETEVTQSFPTLSDPMDCSLPGSSVHGISRQECHCLFCYMNLSLPNSYSDIYEGGTLILLYIPFTFSYCLWGSENVQTTTQLHSFHMLAR